MWRQIGLIGRDKLLKQELYWRLKKRVSFALIGPAGVGKTALLEWCFDHAKEPKVFLSSSHTVRENLQAFCKALDLQLIDNKGKKIAISRATVNQLEQACLKVSDVLIFIDDFERSTPSWIRRLKLFAERHVLIVATRPKIKEDLKPLMWGMSEINIMPLEKKYRQKLAFAFCNHLGSATSIKEIATKSRGYPARMLAQAKGEASLNSMKVEGEELDISPLLLLAIACLVAVRYVAIGLNETDLYVLGGIGAAIGLFARFMLYRGMK